MSLRDYVTFAQEHISRQTPSDRESASPRWPGHEAQTRMADEQLTPNNNPSGERPPHPDWLSDPSSDLIPIEDLGNLIIEDEASIIAGIVAARLRDTLPVTQHGADALAYYLPYHFYRDGHWGIYLRAVGIAYLANVMKGGPVGPTDSAVLRASEQLLYDHEFFHCLAETAATRAEVVVRDPLYHPYFHDRRAIPHEEAMANAHAFRQMVRQLYGNTRSLSGGLVAACSLANGSDCYRSFWKKVEEWMKSQGVGYRDFDNWIYAGNFVAGKAKCGTNILQCVRPPRPIPAGLPAGSLFHPVLRREVPTYLVLETGVAGLNVVRRFPKDFGLRVAVHTRGEHPPPHIHIESPPGTEKTRYVWPLLQPMKGDVRLSNKEQAKLHDYLQRHGGEILKKLRAVYPDDDLAMPAMGV